MCFYNRVRFFLSIIGLFIGLFIFTLGNILIDSYYHESIKSGMQMNENVVVLDYGLNEILDKNTIYSSNRIAATDITEIITSSEKSLVYAKKYEDEILTLTAKLVGVSSMNDTIPIPYNDDEILIGDVELVKGRLINANDIALKSEVVVIDEFTESLLYPDGKSIGQELILNIDIPGSANNSLTSEETPVIRKCIIIGVVKNNYSSFQEEMKYRKFMSNKQESVNLDTMIYFPITYVHDSFEISNRKFIVWNSTDKRELATLKNVLMNYQNQYLEDFSSYYVFDRGAIMIQIKEQFNPMRIFLVIIMTALLIISGINAMSTMFFSIKERINEIGIKKALGASKLEILNQFIIEGILMALIASIFTVFLSCVIAIFIQKYINNHLFTVFEIQFSYGNIFLPVLVAIVYGFIFSLIPSYYGAKIKVTDSLRFE